MKKLKTWKAWIVIVSCAILSLSFFSDGALAKAAQHSNELYFTFNSDNPWSDEEIAVLNKWINDFYPAAKKIYGNPSVTATVNIVKGQSAAFGNYVLYLRDTNRPDEFVHELLHAFRGDFAIENSVFEEGMVRAAEVAIFNQFPEYPYWNRHHGYGIDKYYDLQNDPAISLKNGCIFCGFPNPLFAYEMAGYAWGKILIERPHFLATFNRIYYERAKKDRSLTGNTDALKKIVGLISPTVENKSFGRWWNEQHIFNFNPEEGVQIVLKGDNKTLYFFRWEADNFAQPLSGVSVDWVVRDSFGLPLDFGSVVTTEYGWTQIPVNLPEYIGRIKIDIFTQVEGIEYQKSFEISNCFDGGIFGVVKSLNSGLVKIKSAKGSITVPIVNGSFWAPELENMAGTFTLSTGRKWQKTITKDASSYFVILP